MKWIGKKSEAPLDAWTLAHVALGYALSRYWLNNKSLSRGLLAIVAISYLWELAEEKMEQSKHPWFKKAFREKEHWSNRYLADPLADTLGFLIAKR